MTNLRAHRWWLLAAIVPFLVLAPAGSAQTVAACAPGGPPAVFTGAVTSADAKTYRTLPFARPTLTAGQR